MILARSFFRALNLNFALTKKEVRGEEEDEGICFINLICFIRLNSFIQPLF